MNKPISNEVSSKDVPAQKGDEVSKAQPVEDKEQLEALLQFSFIELAAEPRIAINGARISLSCS